MQPLATPSRAGLRLRFGLLVTLLVLLSVSGRAQLATVSNLTDDWHSDDTRDASGTNLIGLNTTHVSLQGEAGTLADDSAIAARLQFVGDAGAPNGTGYLRIDATGSESSKATISLINPGGFASAGSLLSEDFSASYDWLKPETGGRNLAFRFGLQTSAWANSQEGFTPLRTGEAVWDLVLVFIKPATTPGVWENVTIDRNTAGWFVYDQAGNTFWDALPLGGAPLEDPRGGSLVNWAAYDIDAGTEGVQSIFDGATITSIQFGLGSSQPGLAYLADFNSSVLANSYAFAAVPEPATSALMLALGGLALAWARRRGPPVRG